MGKIKGPAQSLADYMIKMSLEHHNTEWAMGLEYELWHEINGNQDLLSTAQITKLKELAAWNKGWITMKYSSDGDTLDFMLLEEWKKKFRENNPF
ncbi:hypothetical protein KKA14_21585 [bacterium]|nr:hypothetical protein [bacterium]